MELKRCTKCGELKPKTNEYFAFNNKSKGILKPRCKECNKGYAKERYENNKDKAREYGKEYRKNNKDKIKEYQEDWRKNNKDKLSEYSKNYYEANKDKVLEYSMEYYKKNRILKGYKYKDKK